MSVVPTLCDTFEGLALRTWRYLDAAQESEIRIGEETLTDINLIDIQDRHPRHVRTHKFTKHQEAKNGADWEWWLISGGRYLNLRLQAKKLYPDGGYTSLYGKGRAQATRFINRAMGDGITPLYCFYNQTDPVARADWPGLNAALSVEQMGCGIASAHAVQGLIVGKRANPTVDELSAHQVPWRHLVCDRPGGDGGEEGTTDPDKDSGEDGGVAPPGMEGDGPDRGADPPGPIGLDLETVRDRVAALVTEYGGEEPELLPESALPEYVQLVRTGELEVYRRNVPARRVTIFECDADASRVRPNLGRR